MIFLNVWIFIVLNVTNGTFYPYLSVLPVSEFDLKCFDLKMSFRVTIAVVLLEEGGEGTLVGIIF